VGLTRFRRHLAKGGYDGKHEEQEGRGKQPRQAFTEEFKAGAVRLVLDEGKTIAQVARDLDLSANSVATWLPVRVGAGLWQWSKRARE
jgi:transposase-like protein